MNNAKDSIHNNVMFHVVVNSSKMHIPTIEELAGNVPKMLHGVVKGLKCIYKKVISDLW